MKLWTFLPLLSVEQRLAQNYGGKYFWGKKSSVVTKFMVLVTSKEVAKCDAAATTASF